MRIADFGRNVVCLLEIGTQHELQPLLTNVLKIWYAELHNRTSFAPRLQIGEGCNILHFKPTILGLTFMRCFCFQCTRLAVEFCLNFRFPVASSACLADQWFVWWRRTWNTGGMIVARENGISGRETCPNSTVSTTSLTSTGACSNPCSALIVDYRYWNI